MAIYTIRSKMSCKLISIDMWYAKYTKIKELYIENYADIIISATYSDLLRIQNRKYILK